MWTVAKAIRLYFHQHIHTAVPVSSHFVWRSHQCGQVVVHFTSPLSSALPSSSRVLLILNFAIEETARICAVKKLEFYEAIKIGLAQNFVGKFFHFFSSSSSAFRFKSSKSIVTLEWRFFSFSLRLHLNPGTSVPHFSGFISLCLFATFLLSCVHAIHRTKHDILHAVLVFHQMRMYIVFAENRPRFHWCGACVWMKICHRHYGHIHTHTQTVKLFPLP